MINQQDAHPAHNHNYRAGFITFVGRPNVGKSSLINAIMGQKVVITSSKPQTTRRAIRSIAHFDNGQIIIVDTPGIHKPRTLLGERLNALAVETLSSVDIIGVCFAANENIGPGDIFVTKQLDKYPKAQKIAILTKTDLASPQTIIRQLEEINDLLKWDCVIPLSAKKNEQLDVLCAEVLKLLPLSEPLYPEDMLTEEGEETRIAELIREASLEGVHDELPHSIAVTIDDIITDDESLTKIYASIFVERDSQKGIIIGKKGVRLSHIGKTSRLEIERLLNRKVFLSIRVKVASEWQKDPKQLGKLGF